MKTVTYLRGMIATLTFILSLVQSIPAVAIEGKSNEVLNRYSQLLNSVVRFEVKLGENSFICTATPIAKNILLTARHCVVTGEEEGVPGKGSASADPEVELPAGTPLVINFNEPAEIIKVIKQPLLYTHGFDTDMALMLIKTSPSSPFQQLKTIQLGTESAAPLSNWTLIAGYGNQSRDPQMENKNGVPLAAGLNEWSRSNFCEVNRPRVPAAGKNLNWEQLLLVGDRTEVFHMVATAGRKTDLFDGPSSGDEIKIAENQATPMMGDSGSAAFGFDAQGNPFVVGVASRGVDNYRNPSGIYSVFARATDGSEIKKMSVTLLGDRKNFALKVQIQKKLIQELVNQGWLGSDRVAKKTFEVITEGHFEASGFYASVFSPVNRNFLKQSLTILKSVDHQASGSRPVGSPGSRQLR